MLPNNDTWRKNKCNCWENIIIPRICLVIPKIRKLKTIKNHIEWIFILVHYSLVQMSTWNYHLQKTNWYFLVNGLVAVRNGCWCSLKVTICSCFSGKSDESGNKLVMFSKNLYLAQCFFLSFLFALCLTQKCPDSLAWLRVNRERDGEDEGSRNETDRLWDTETGAEGGCQNLGDCTRQHSGAFGFEVSLLWQAEVTHASYRKTFKPQRCATLCYKSMRQKMRERCREWEKERRRHLALFVKQVSNLNLFLHSSPWVITPQL